MKNIYTLPDIKEYEIEEQAGLWIAKMDRGLNADETQSLKAWLEEHPRQQEIFFETITLWDNMAALNKLSSLFPQTTPVTQKKSFFTPAIAACIVALLAITSVFLQQSIFTFKETESSSHQQLAAIITHTTAVGESKTISLSDGSQLSLNTDSLAKVKFSPTSRVIILEKGEIHITVAHNPNRPLSVLANNKVIQAVGTAFNVFRLDNNQVALTVSDGKVLVAEQNDDSLIPSRLNQSDTNALAVSVKQRVILGSDTEEVSTLTKRQLRTNLAWKEGRIIFKRETLEKAIQRVSRYTPVSFSFSDDTIRTIKIGGVYRTGDVDGLLLALDKSFGISHQKIGNNILLRKKTNAE